MRRCLARLEDYNRLDEFGATGNTTHIREPFSAPDVTALVRLLARVGSDVDSQGASLNEALATSWRHTRIRPFVRVDAVVPLKIRLAIETLEYEVNSLFFLTLGITYLVASLPVTLERSCIRLILD